MKPEASDILNISAEQLMGLIPHLGAPYLQSATAIHALLIKFSAKEYERGADIRAAENAAMRTVFAELAPVATDAALQARLEAAAKTRDESLAISSLDAGNAELRTLLIALHAHVEDIGAHAAARRLWTLLKDMAARRAVSLF